MPLIPTSANLGQREFQDRSQVVSPRLDFSGQNQFIDTAIKVVDNINDRLDESSLQKAKIEFQKRKLEADAAFDQDPDFATHETRYNEMIGKATDETSKMIRNPRLQEEFKQSLSLYQTEGALNIKKRAFMKETDQGVSNLDSTLTLARENYLRSATQADKDLATNTISDAIDVAHKNGYIDTEKATIIRQKAAVDLAVASIKTAPATEQLRLLKEHKGLIDVIPTDVRMEMIKQAEDHSVNDQALILANGITAKGGSATDRLNAADAIKDPKIRENVKQQIEVDLSREKRAKAETEYNAYDELKKSVIAGKTSLEVMNESPAQWNAMSADQQAHIRSMDTNKSEVSDINTYNTLNQLAAKDVNQAYTYFAENAHKLSISDQKKWSDRLAAPDELEGYLTRIQRLDTALTAIGVKDKKGENYKLAQDQLDKDTIAFEKEKGRKPNAEELTKLVNGVTDTIVEGHWYKSGTYGFNLTPEQRKEKTAQNKIDNFTKNLNEYKEHLSDKQGGIPVILTDEEVNRLYNAWDKKGLLDGN